VRVIDTFLPGRAIVQKQCHAVSMSFGYQTRAERSMGGVSAVARVSPWREAPRRIVTSLAPIASTMLWNHSGR